MTEPYEYSRQTYWESIDRARERLGLKKNQFSRMLGATPGYFSTCLNDLTDMKISYAWKYAAAVGLTLDEAIRGDGRNSYIDFLASKHISYERLPEDSMLRSYLYKSLIPTLFQAVDLCRDRNIVDIVKGCLMMDDKHLFQFFYKIFRSDYADNRESWAQDYPQDYNGLRESLMKPAVNELFWLNGVHHKIGEEGLLGELEQQSKGARMKAFAQKLGISLGQLYKYQRIGENSAGTTTEPRLSRVVEICNALGANVDEMIEPCHSIKTYANADLHVYQEYDTDFTVWKKRFFRIFQNNFHALPLIAMIINQYGYIPESEQNSVAFMALNMAGLEA